MRSATPTAKRSPLYYRGWAPRATSPLSIDDAHKLIDAWIATDKFVRGSRRADMEQRRVIGRELHAGGWRFVAPSIFAVIEEERPRRCILVRREGLVVARIDTTDCAWCTDEAVCSACASKADRARKEAACAT